MGVPGLFSYLAKRYPEAIHQLSNCSSPVNIPIDHFLIDGNALLHPVARGYYFAKVKRRLTKVVQETPPIKTDQECYELIGKTVEELIGRVHPLKSVVFGIDGAVNIAKSAEQRKRRFGSASAKKEGQFDTCNISVATPWMKKLHTFLEKEVWRWGFNFPGIEITYDSYLVPGECEHRLVEVVRRVPPEESCMVHGSDADIISLLLATHRDNCYILRDRTDEGRTESAIIDITRLRRCLLDDYIPQVRRVSDEARLNSMIFVWYCVGMDFLPRCPSLEIFNGGMELIANTMGEIMKKYGAIVSHDAKGKLIINKIALARWFMLVSTHDSAVLKRKAEGFGFTPDPLLQECTTLTHDGTFVNVGKYHQLYNENKFSGRGELQKACKEYINGLYWTFLYYTKGVPSWSWFYPYHYSPWAGDIADALISPRHSWPRFKRGEPVPETLQLLFILPPQSFDLLPKELRGLAKKYPEMFPEEVEIDDRGIEREWEAKHLTPFVDHKLLYEEYMELYPYRSTKTPSVTVKIIE